MTTNIGTLDRAARMLLGLVLLSLLFILEGAWRWVGLVGFIPLGTALAGWCPAYALFGLSSCPVEWRLASLNPARQRGSAALAR